MKEEILKLLTQAESEKGNIGVAIETLDKAKTRLQDMEGSQQSRRNDTSGDTQEIIYLHKYGNILYGIEEYKQASDKYTEIVTKQSQPKVDTHKALGDCLRKLNLYDKALEKYEGALQIYKKDRSANSEDKAGVYNSIGLTYLAKGDNEILALKAFEKAINCRTKNTNPLYYCNKGSILYGITGRKEEGIDCFNEAVKLVEENKIEGLTKQNINYIMEILKPFIELESKIKALQPKIEVSTDSSFIKQFQEVLEFVTHFPQKQESSNKSFQESFNYLKRVMVLIQDEVQMMKEEIENIKKVTKEKFEELASKNEITYNMFDNKFRMIEMEVNGVKEWQFYIDDTLTEANVFVEVETKRKFESLERDHGKEVYEYAIKFYGALSDSLHAYRMISTGLIKGKSDDYTGIVKKISEVLGVAGKVFLPLSIAGGIIGIVNGFYEKYSEVKLDRIAKKVADSISGSLLEKDLNLAITSSAIEIAIAKKQTITKTAAQEPTKMEGVQEWFSEKLEKLALKITKIKDVPESKVSKMALKDVSLFIIKSIIKSDDKLVESSEDAKKLDQKIEELFKADVAIKQLFTKLYDEIHHKGLPESSVVQMVYEVVYDNPLLNNLELMKNVAKLFGVNLNEVLSQGLITEAIENNDPNIILAGLISLDGSECI